MEDAKRTGMAKGIALAAAYCAAYLAMRHLSFDQWFLPAGLRAACLLLVPMRWWPYLFAGDAAALLVTRTPMADRYGELWSYLSPFLLIGLISIVPWALRRRLATPADVARWLPGAALAIAFWSSACNMAVNFALSGPVPEATLEKFGRYVVGDFLGILLIVPVCLLWLRRRDEGTVSLRLAFDACVALVAAGVMYCAITMIPGADDSFRLLVLMLMILPAVFLTLLHGWQGAAVGVAMVNLCIAQTLDYTGVPGNHDETVFLAQQALSIASGALLVLGGRISESYDRARRSGAAEATALGLARKSFLSTERMLREQLLYTAQMQLLLDDERRDLADWLKSHGHYSAAMALNSRGVMHRRVFDEQALALYPIRIEEDGLYAVLHSEAFTDFWAGETEIRYSLRGQPRTLTVDLQLVAYRCVCHAMALLSECDPDDYRVKMRVWQNGRRRGIAVFVTAAPTAALQPTQAGVAAAALLSARVKAHGGIVRRHAHRVGLFLSEPLEAEPLPVR